MPAVDLSIYHQAQGTTSDGNKFDNFIDAVQATLNGLDNGNMAAGFKRTTSSLAGGPPGSPSDGDIWIATAVDANGTRWGFQYNAGSASAFKWEALGCPAIVSVVDTAESTASVAAVDLATVGPSFVAVRAGEYFIGGAARVTAGTGYGQWGPKIGAGAITDAGVVQGGMDSTFLLAPNYYTVAAADTIKLQYHVTGGTACFWAQRRMEVRPRRIS